MFEMKMMECREEQVRQSLIGLNETGIPLVGICDNAPTIAGWPDDPGIYYFIPQIAKLFGISIESAIAFFIISLLLIGASFSICCFFSLFKDWLSRTIAVVGITLLSVLGYRYYDVYIAGLVAVEIAVPLLLLWEKNSQKLDLKFSILLAFIGIAIGYCNFIRLHAGTGAFIFAVCWILLSKNQSFSKKGCRIFLIALFILIPMLHIRHLEQKRDQYLKKVGSYSILGSVAHPKWHNTYIGFAYLKNSYGIEYDDSVSYNKAMSINPHVIGGSAEYNKILQDQCILLAKTDPWFVAKTVGAKMFSLLVTMFIMMNLGFFACFYVRPTLRVIFPFLITALFYALPGILTMPYRCYVSGMVATSAIWGIYMISLALAKFQKNQEILQEAT